MFLWHIPHSHLVSRSRRSGEVVCLSEVVIILLFIILSFSLSSSLHPLYFVSPTSFFESGDAHFE